MEGNTFSPSYLTQMALYFCHLILDVSEKNIMLQGNTFLGYVEPEQYGAFRSKLIADEARLKKGQISLHFVPMETTLLPHHGVEISGELVSYVGSKRVTQSVETYRLQFAPKMGRLFIRSFETLKTTRQGGDDGS